MTRKDRGRADVRFNKADSGKIERDAALKAITDNMAKLKALRLARERSEPPRLPATAARHGQKGARQVKEARRKGSRIGGMAGEPAKRRTPDLRPFG